MKKNMKQEYTNREREFINNVSENSYNEQSTHNLEHFIPSGMNPDNGEWYEGNHNPLSSKGE